MRWSSPNIGVAAARVEEQNSGVSADWEPPEDDGEMYAWLDNFADKLPKYAAQLNITTEALEQIRRERGVFCGAHDEFVQKSWDALVRSVSRFRPREEWPSVYAEATQDLIVTPEPRRTRWLEFLQEWFEGIRRVQGRAVQPLLQGGHYDRGIDLQYVYPPEATRMSLYFRVTGEKGWAYLSTNIQKRYSLETILDDEDLEADPEGLAERQSWQGKELEFVAVAESEERPIGFPSEIVRVRVKERMERAKG